MLKSEFGSAIVDGFLKQDVGYMLADLKEIFAQNDEEFQQLVVVLKESFGEFLMDLYVSTEENVTIEDLFDRLKKIVNRRIDEA